MVEIPSVRPDEDVGAFWRDRYQEMAEATWAAMQGVSRDENYHLKERNSALAGIGIFDCGVYMERYEGYRVVPFQHTSYYDRRTLGDDMFIELVTEWFREELSEIGNVGD